MIKAIIFDWDDVFTFGSTKGYYAVTQRCLEDVGVDMPLIKQDELLRATWGLGHVEQLQQMLVDHPDLVDDAVASYEKHLFGGMFVECLSIVDGSQDLLRELAKDYKLSIATGAHPKVLIDQLFPKFAIPNVFEKIITVYDLDDPNHGKPHPFMAESILAHMGVAPNEAVLVGDAPTDVLMAQAAGVEPIVVLTGHLDEATAKTMGVRHIIPEVTDLPALLKSL